jgi:hypothetical protein
MKKRRGNQRYILGLVKEKVNVGSLNRPNGVSNGIHQLYFNFTLEAFYACSNFFACIKLI